MKYIRTKDNIVSAMQTVRKADIVDYGDSVEELCDAFVHGKMVFKTLEECLDYAPLGGNIYGHIWVNDSLIKVAKLNKKGELELL